MQRTSYEMLGWMTHKLESRLPREIPATSDMQVIPLYWQKVKGNWRASWWRWKRRVKKLAYPKHSDPWRLSGKESACQWRRHRFNPWCRKIPHASEQLSPCTTATDWLCSRVQEPPQLSSGTTVTLWSPCSAIREAHALQLGSSPHSWQLQRCLRRSEAPV